MPGFPGLLLLADNIAPHFRLLYAKHVSLFFLWLCVSMFYYSNSVHFFATLALCCLATSTTSWAALSKSSL